MHTVLVPDLSASFGEGRGGDQSAVTRALQENMNPALNGSLVSKNTNVSPAFGGLGQNNGGFEGWADNNSLTMKTLDAYRMHLWGKMAAQHQFQRSQQAQTHRSSPAPTLTGLASGLRPLFFAAPSSSAAPLYPTPPATPTPPHHNNIPMGSSLSTLLSGKSYNTLGSGSGYSSHSSLPTPPGSPTLNKGNSSSSSSDREADRFNKEREQREHAALAVIAGQTLFKKLGSAFWDAFSGHSSSTASSLSPLSGKSNKDWDVDKVRKVLEGKAVVRVVDVEPERTTPSSSISTLTAGMATMGVEDKKSNEKRCRCTDILEESMRSLTVSKKV